MVAADAKASIGWSTNNFPQKVQGEAVSALDVHVAQAMGRRMPVGPEVYRTLGDWAGYAPLHHARMASTVGMGAYAEPGSVLGEAAPGPSTKSSCPLSWQGRLLTNKT